ncbi:MAG TPA: DNA-processing protein DprA [Dehalococcoidia bacterium]|nr:DNA-processing protein DprA [Dehalococcoidia bacterium]
MSVSDLPYWVAFNRIPGIGRVRHSLLEKRFGRLEEAWKAPPSELREAGLDERTVASIIERRPKISPPAEMEGLARLQIQALTWHDPRYPRRLKEIYDLPPLLYVRGQLTEADEWAVAVVGTRRPTPYGRQAAEELSHGLARSGVTVISGLARGIDAIAHRAALDAGGRTIAVLACGLDRVYPAEHARLALEIAQRGALVSDYPLDTQPRGEYFPRRNRIMSGLSLGVLVVEGDVKSGAMITAGLALEQNREVFAVPGSIFSPQSRGTHALIRDGAKLVQRTEDILEELNLTIVPQQLEVRETIPATDTESSLLRYISTGPLHVDEVCRRSGLPVATVSSVLAMLELKGLVRQVGPMSYVRARETQVVYGA